MLAPGCLVNVAEPDSIYSNIVIENNRWYDVEESHVAHVEEYVGFVIAVSSTEYHLGQTDPPVYTRSYVIHPDHIGWVLLAQDECVEQA